MVTHAIWFRLKGRAQSALSILFLIAAWEVMVRVLQIPEYLLPAPSKVFARVASDYWVLFQHAVITAGEILAGFLLSAAVGFPVAVLIVYSPFLERSLYPVVVFLQTIPKIAIAPLFVIWLGVGTLPKALVAFLISFFPIVIDSVVGLRSVAPGMIYLVQSMGARPLDIFVKVRLPASLPYVFAGLKVAATLSVVGAIVGEFVGADRGLGYLLLTANGLLDTTLLFASLSILTLMGLVLFYLLEWAERLLVPWHVTRKEGQEPTGFNIAM